MSRRQDRENVPNKILTNVAVVIGLGINFAFWIGFVWMIALAADHGPEVWSLG